jgi:hypothetical protein
MCRRRTDDGDVGGERVRRVGRDIFVDRLIHTDVTNHYNSDGSSSLSATARNRSGHLKILDFQH